MDKKLDLVKISCFITRSNEPYKILYKIHNKFFHELKENFIPFIIDDDGVIMNRQDYHLIRLIRPELFQSIFLTFTANTFEPEFNDPEDDDVLGQDDYGYYVKKFLFSEEDGANGRQEQR